MSKAASKTASSNSGAHRSGAGAKPDIGPFRARHMSLNERIADTPGGPQRVTVDDAESPLIWLAKRRGRDGQALVAPHQLQAGERLRADFTRGHFMPRTTTNWSTPLASGRGESSDFADGSITARERVNAALEAVGPEFSGLLLDLCCFLKGLEDIERARGWPARSAKVVLQLALDRLARHYGFTAEARGKRNAPVRTWLAEGETFRVD